MESVQELVGLQATYPDLVEFTIDSIPDVHPIPDIGVNRENIQRVSGCITVPISLESPIQLTLTGHEASKSISHFPPIRLHFEIPTEYPNVAPKLWVSSNWLSTAHHRTLESSLLSLWDHDIVLFIWYDYIQRGALHCLFPDTFGQSNADITTTHTFLLPLLITSLVVEFDTAQKQIQFESTRHVCGICFEDQKGTECLELNQALEQDVPCHHAFCKNCLKDYFEYLVIEGSVDLVSCPHQDCKKAWKEQSQSLLDAIGEDVKLNGHASISLIPDRVLKQILSPELMSRYHSLLEKKAIEARSDVTYCPRPSCQAPVFSTKDQKFCVCRECAYTFCYYCRRLYHGNNTNCQMDGMSLIVKEYLDESTLAERKRQMELQYGVKVLERIVRLVQENASSENWISNHAQPCPSCSMPISKVDGCNHMSCNICQVHFCYLCASVLDKAAPYHHFNDPSSSCFDKLYAVRLDLEDKPDEDAAHDEENEDEEDDFPPNFLVYWQLDEGF